MSTKEILSESLYQANLILLGEEHAKLSRSIYEAGWDSAIQHAPEVMALVSVCKLILKEWELPTNGVQIGTLIGRLSQYSIEAREALKPFEGGNK